MNQGYFTKECTVRGIVLFCLLAFFSNFGFADEEHRHQWTTSGGTKVIFIQTSVLPIVDVAIDFAAGAAFDPVGKEGLARFTLRLLDKGTETSDEQQLAERLAGTGSQLGGTFDLDRSGLTLRSLAFEDELTDSLSIVEEMLHAPTFPSEILDREIKSGIASLNESVKRPGTVASRAFYEQLYPDHPYRSTGVGTEESLRSLSSSDLLSFYKRFYRRTNGVVTIVGDLTLTRATEISEQLSDALPIGDEVSENLIAPDVGVIDRETVIYNPASQAHIRIGALGVKRGDPDYLPLMLANQILGGGGMTSILYDELREKRGLTYGVYSYFSPLRSEGPFVISFQTRKDQAKDALDLAMELARKFVREGPTLAQLQNAKRYFIGAFALNVDSNAELLDYYSTIGFYGLPLDYIDSFSQRVENVTLEEVNDALKSRLTLENTIRIIVGPGEEFSRTDG